MKTTTCFMGGKEYRVDFEETVITSGTLYHGTVFENHIFEFFFVIFANGSPLLFSPLDTPQDRQEAIVSSIRKPEEHHRGHHNPLSGIVF